MGFLRPKVDGGMTMQEMQLMREEERNYLSQQQDRQFQQLREFELERDMTLLQRQEAERNREQQALLSMQQAESIAIDEAEDLEDETDTGFTSFSTSLMTNLAKRPE